MSVVTADASAKFDCRNAFAETLETLAEVDPRIMIVVNDSVGSSKLNRFANRFPERTVNVGIAEQDMVGVAAGLANGGQVPFVSAASCFLTARAMEQIKADVAYSNVNVKLIGQSPGFAYGELGPTHHSIEDIAWLRILPNLKIVVPSDPWETAEAVKAAAAHQGPVFIRVSRSPVPEIPRPSPARFVFGKAELLRDGNDAAIITNGVMINHAFRAVETLEAEGLRVRVVNMSSIAPLDVEAITSAAETGAVVTVEEGSIRGGLGGAVAEIIATTGSAHLRILGLPGFAPTGSVQFLFEHFGLTSDDIADAVRGVVAARGV